MIRRRHRRLAALVATAAATTLVPAAAGAQSAPAEPTIVDTVIAVSGGDGFDADRTDYDILRAAVVTADLVGVLADPDAELTVLAPDDRAFVRTARELGYLGRSESGAWNFLVAALTELGEGDPVGPLTTVLTTHVLGGDLDYRAVRTGGERTTVSGVAIAPQPDRSIVDADPDNRDARLDFFRSNIAVGNGTIHTVDRVILPLDLAQPHGTLAERLPGTAGEFDRNLVDYDLLATALGATGLDAAVADEAAELTVLAPNDLAFVFTARELGYHGWNETGAWEFLVGALTELGGGDPIPVLTEILTYHVIGEELDYREVRTGGDRVALNGGTLGFQPDRTIVDAAPYLTDAKLLFGRSGLEADNGVLHTVTRVLIPVDIG